MDKEQNFEGVKGFSLGSFAVSWEQRKVFELAEKTYGGGTPATSNEAFWNGNIPWIQSSDILDGKLFGVEPRKHITQEGLHQLWCEGFLRRHAFKRSCRWQVP